MTPAGTPRALGVLHLGAGRYDPEDRHHATFDIWRRLASGFGRYTVIGRSIRNSWARIEEGNLTVLLMPSRTPREIEFLFTQFRALAVAQSVQPDVVVSQCPVLGGLAAQWIRRRTGARTLLEMHMATYMQPARPGSRWGTLQRLSRRTLPGATRIRVLSAGMRRDLLAFYGSGLADKVVVLPPRVDLDRFTQRRRDWKIEGRPRIVLVGSITERKGQLRYLSAMFDSGLDAESWIIGDGPQRAACEALVAAAGAQNSVRFFGSVSHGELADILPRADMLVQFSSMEGTPRAIMEAMAVGLPIVTTDAGYCSDVVTHGVEGFVLGRDPAAELPHRLTTLFGDQALREMMGRAGMARVEQEFEADQVFGRYRALIADTARA